VRVLGVDPGLSRCGVGVVEGSPVRPVAVRAGVIRTPAGQATGLRLLALADALAAVVQELRPDAVAVERVFFNDNARTAMGVGQAAGVALLCAARSGVPVVEYTPTQVKAAIAGNGAAEKEQVMFMVRALLRLPETPRPPDAADALALALCHLHRAGHPGGGAGAGDAVGMSPRLAAAVADAPPGAPVARAGTMAGVRPGARPGAGAAGTGGAG
jgi:crossover junction endodeoxyribonuclease RuvC